eukprot:scaffold16486_cov20-Tisochrysis_lutea.AAC.1
MAQQSSRWAIPRWVMKQWNTWLQEGTGAEARVMYDNQAQLNWGQETRKANLYESHVSQVPFSPQHFLARKPGGKT